MGDLSEDDDDEYAGAELVDEIDEEWWSDEWRDVFVLEGCARYWESGRRVSDWKDDRPGRVRPVFRVEKVSCS